MNPSTIGRRWTWGRLTRAFWVTRNGLDPCRPADRVLLNEAWILEGRQYFDRPRNGIQSDFRFIYTPIRTTLYKKSPVKVADNRPHPPLSLHSIHTLFPSSLSLNWKANSTQFGLTRGKRDGMRCEREFSWNLILVTIVERGRGAVYVESTCLDKRVFGVWSRKLETAYFTGRRIRPARRKIARRNRSLARGISELGRVSRRRQRGKVARKFDTVEANFSSPPPLFFGGEKSVEDLARPHLVRFDGWVKTDEWYDEGRKGQLGSWFNPLEKYRGFVKSSFLAILSFVLISFVIKLIRWLV